MSKRLDCRQILVRQNKKQFQSREVQRTPACGRKAVVDMFTNAASYHEFGIGRYASKRVPDAVNEASVVGWMRTGDIKYPGCLGQTGTPTLQRFFTRPPRLNPIGGHQCLASAHLLEHLMVGLGHCEAQVGFAYRLALQLFDCLNRAFTVIDTQAIKDVSLEDTFDIL